VFDEQRTEIRGSKQESSNDTETLKLLPNGSTRSSFRKPFRRMMSTED